MKKKRKYKVDCNDIALLFLIMIMVKIFVSM